ncbi:hypothetical protein [Photobacterium leiognathi]|uniref:hypothetical protein n=1 Tax=Photobacterium leiognathi TaxID=553611 RepID=UPI002981C703|nr:hypothetical protein [Photobacterium leiognathi]
MFKILFNSLVTLSFVRVFLPKSNKHVPAIFLPEHNAVVANDSGMGLLEFAGGAQAIKDVIKSGFAEGTQLKLIPAYLVDKIGDLEINVVRLGYCEPLMDYTKADNQEVEAHVLVSNLTKSVIAVSSEKLEPKNNLQYASSISFEDSQFCNAAHLPYLVGCHIDQLHHNPHLHLNGNFSIVRQRIEFVHGKQRFALEDSKLNDKFRYQLFTTCQNFEPEYLFNGYHWHCINEDKNDMPLFMSSHGI